MSKKLPLSLACGDYEIVRPLMDGRVKPDGIDLTAIRRCGIGTTGDVVRLHVVVDERDPLADADDQLTRIGAGR